MIVNIPLDISAETLLNYLSDVNTIVDLKGPHKRNAYEDILSLNQEDDRLSVELSRAGIYDILPEALFHPIDRFENIPANEYKEKFAEEYESQQIEEANARKFFAPFDSFILNVSCIVDRIKNDRFSDNSILSDIICDMMPEKYLNNRFVKKFMPYMPLCNRIRGNKSLLTLILRKILIDEGITMIERSNPTFFRDESPRYNSAIDDVADESGDLYLGNEYMESVTEYEITYWNEDECDASFLSFVSDINVLEAFITDFFIGIESKMRFNISTTAMSVRLSDDIYYNYLDYNTNL